MTHNSAKTRVALVGAGFIARDHLDALRTLGRRVETTAICDLREGRARRLATAFGIARVHSSLEEMLAREELDAVHLVLPPPEHFPAASRCLEAGLHCFVEKPLCLAQREIEELAELARARGVHLGVNHNLTFNPAFRRLQRHLEQGRLGRPEQLDIVHNTPLAQLQSGDVSHFMFRTEANILYEQGVHLFSLVQVLLGRCLGMEATTSAPRRLPNGCGFRERWELSLHCTRGRARIFMAYGRTMPETSLQLLGSDGWARVDLLRGSWQHLGKSRWLDFLDRGLGLAGTGVGLCRQGVAGVVDYGLALFGLRPPSDPFSRGMRGSIAAFHRALRAGEEPPLGAKEALQVGEMCELAAAAARVSRQPAPAREAADPGPARQGEVLITGATGFIGRRLVSLLRREGRPLTLLVRRPDSLAESLCDRSIRIFPGDARDEQAVAAAAAGARRVVHLATCAGEDPERIEANMARSVEVTGRAALAAGVERYIFISTVAALYLGGREAVTGAVGPDPRPARRPAYARGKIAAEAVLGRLHREEGLPGLVLRPAIVVGEGGLAEHSGVGLWVKDNHCVGWGHGRNPLPFLLVEDCARAIAAALEAPGLEGRAFNLAGDVRICAMEYVELLRRVTGRDHHFHPTGLRSIWLQELGKYLVKRAARRRGEIMSMRDLRTRAFLAPLDTRDTQEALGWRPVADREQFIARAIAVHGPGAEEMP